MKSGELIEYYFVAEIWYYQTFCFRQHVGLVTFATPEAAVHAHSAHTFLNVATSTDRTAKVHVFMRGGYYC